FPARHERPALRDQYPPREGLRSHRFALAQSSPTRVGTAKAKLGRAVEGRYPNLSSQTMNDSPLREIYVSTDIETDGPVAGKHSMLRLGSAAYLADKELLGTFSANLETLPASAADPKTAACWATQPDAWSACRQNLEAPAVALRRYVAWLKAFGGRPVFVG